MKRVLAGLAAVAIALSAAPSFAQEKLTVWWVKGFYKSEDDALYAAIKKFEAKTGVKVELSQYAVQDMNAEVGGRARRRHRARHRLFRYLRRADRRQVGLRRQARGHLRRHRADEGPLLAGHGRDAFLYSDKAKKKAYYAFPIKQQTLHIQYWKDMLGQAGFKENDIPGTWKEYWSFWCDKVQPAIRKATGQRIYGIGSPMGVESTDSFQSFLSWVDAYNVKLVDDSGKLLVDDPKVREGLIKALKDYTDVYTKGCTPPSSTTWKDPDNNVAFHNKTIVMTHNYTISIAAKWLDDANNEQLTAEQRAAGRKAYDELIATAGFPKKPDGTPMVYRTAVKVGVIFEGSKNKERAQRVPDVPDGRGKSPPLCRGRARPLVPGDQGEPGEPVLAGRQASQGGLRPVQGRHAALRVHQELQVHHPEQRERLGQGDEPGGQREGSGRQGGRRADRPHQAGRRLILPRLGKA